MQLIEINYSEKYDTFTGYLANDPDYFRYEVDREKVELTPMDGQFDDRDDFIRTISKMNPHASFLVDPIEIRDINYKELERYKRLSLATLGRPSSMAAIFPVKTVILAISLLLLSWAFYHVATTYFGENAERKIVIPIQVERRQEIQYIYEIHLVGGGTLEGRGFERDSEKILIKDKKGLEVVLKLPAVRYVERMQEDNKLSRSVIYGTKP